MEGDFILLLDFKIQLMALLHLDPVQFEVLRRPPARMMIPAIGEQDAADVHKQGGDRDAFFHAVGGLGIWRIGFVMAKPMRFNVFDKMASF